MLEDSHVHGAHCLGENNKDSTSAHEGGAVELEGAAKDDVKIEDGGAKVDPGRPKPPQGLGTFLLEPYQVDNMIYFKY